MKRRKVYFFHVAEPAEMSDAESQAEITRLRAQLVIRESENETLYNKLCAAEQERDALKELVQKELKPRLERESKAYEAWAAAIHALYPDRKV